MYDSDMLILAATLFINNKITRHQMSTLIEIDEVRKFNQGKVDVHFICQEEIPFPTPEAIEFLTPALRSGHLSYTPSAAQLAKFFVTMSELPRSEQIFYIKHTHPEDLDDFLKLILVKNRSMIMIPNKQEGSPAELHLSTGAEDMYGLSCFGLTDWVPTIITLGEKMPREIEYGVRRDLRFKAGLFPNTVAYHNLHEYPDHTIAPITATRHDDYHAKLMSLIGSACRKALIEMVAVIRETLLARAEFPITGTIDPTMSSTVWRLIDAEIKFFNIDAGTSFSEKLLTPKLRKLLLCATLTDKENFGLVDSDISTVLYINMLLFPQKWAAFGFHVGDFREKNTLERIKELNAVHLVKSASQEINAPGIFSSFPAPEDIRPHLTENLPANILRMHLYQTVKTTKFAIYSAVLENDASYILEQLVCKRVNADKFLGFKGKANQKTLFDADFRIIIKNQLIVHTLLSEQLTLLKNICLQDETALTLLTQEEKHLMKYLQLAKDAVQKNDVLKPLSLYLYLAELKQRCAQHNHPALMKLATHFAQQLQAEQLANPAAAYLTITRARIQQAKLPQGDTLLKLCTLISNTLQRDHDEALRHCKILQAELTSLQTSSPSAFLASAQTALLALAEELQLRPTSISTPQSGLRGGFFTSSTAKTAAATAEVKTVTTTPATSFFGGLRGGFLLPAKTAAATAAAKTVTPTPPPKPTPTSFGGLKPGFLR